MTARGTIASSAQVDMLLECLEEKRFLVTGHARTTRQRDKTRAAWQEIALKLNKDYSGCYKTWQQWAKYWKDKKGAAKRKVVQIQMAEPGSGGGDGEEMSLTETEGKILALMGGSDGFSKFTPPPKETTPTSDCQDEDKSPPPSDQHSTSQITSEAVRRRRVLTPRRRLLQRSQQSQQTRRTPMESMTERLIAIEEGHLENHKTLIENQKKMFDIFMEMSKSLSRQTQAIQELCTATRELVENKTSMNWN